MAEAEVRAARVLNTEFWQGSDRASKAQHRMEPNTNPVEWNRLQCSRVSSDLSLSLLYCIIVKRAGVQS